MREKKTIMIVEDEPALLHILCRMLQEAGLHTLTAEDGVVALRKALQERPALILLDLIMPRMDGLTMLKRLREDPWGRTAQVIVFTNMISTEKERECKRLGAKEYIVKTELSIPDLIRVIKKYVPKEKLRR